MFPPVLREVQICVLPLCAQPFVLHNLLYVTREFLCIHVSICILVTHVNKYIRNAWVLDCINQKCASRQLVRFWQATWLPCT